MQVYNYTGFETGGEYNQPPVPSVYPQKRFEGTPSNAYQNQQARSTSVSHNPTNPVAQAGLQRENASSNNNNHQYQFTPQPEHVHYQKPPPPPANSQSQFYQPNNSRKVSAPESNYGQQQTNSTVYSGNYLNSPATNGTINYREVNPNSSLPSQHEQAGRFDQNQAHTASFNQYLPQPVAQAHSYADIYRGYQPPSPAEANDTSIYLQNTQPGQQRPASGIYSQHPAPAQTFFHSARNIAVSPAQNTYAPYSQDPPGEPKQSAGYSNQYYPQPQTNFAQIYDHQPSYTYPQTQNAYQPIARGAPAYPQPQMHARMANPLKCPGTWSKRNERPHTGS